MRGFWIPLPPSFHSNTSWQDQTRLCELIRLHFKRENNNIRKKIYWVRQIFMGRHSKIHFHVLVKELKLFYLITSSPSSTFLFDILFFHSDVWQYLFCFSIGCIQQLHWLIILSNNFFRFGVNFFFSSKTEKTFPVQGKEIIMFLAGALAQS